MAKGWSIQMKDGCPGSVVHKWAPATLDIHFFLTIALSSAESSSGE